MADDFGLQLAIGLGRLDGHVRRTRLAQAHRPSFTLRVQAQRDPDSPGERGRRLANDDRLPAARERVGGDCSGNREQDEDGQHRRQQKTGQRGGAEQRGAADGRAHRGTGTVWSAASIAASVV